MRRRELLGLTAVAGVFAPFAAPAEEAVRLIGFLHPGTPGPFAPFTASFLNGLHAAGYVEGRNVAIEYRWAEGNSSRLPAFVADLAGRKVELIATVGEETTRIAKATSASIPIVFFTAADPVEAKFVAGLARPEGNVTGVTVFGGELNPKRLEFASELVPHATTVAVLTNPANSDAARVLRGIRQAAQARALRCEEVAAGSAAEIDRAFEMLARQKPDALIVTSDIVFFSRREQIVAAASRTAIPTVYYRREFADAGGLIAYGPSYADGYRRVGALAAKILDGAKPADLPVEQPTKFELVINLKAAKALGLGVPQSLLARADEVIE